MDAHEPESAITRILTSTTMRPAVISTIISTIIRPVIRPNALVWLAALFGMTVTSATAQQIVGAVTASAGGPAANGSYLLLSTLGEPAIGWAFNDSESYVSGFWAVGAPPSVSTPVEDAAPSGLPDAHRLAANYPNPFNPSTTLRFDVSASTQISIRIFNALGQVVSVPIDRPLVAGEYRIRFDAEDLPSGVYYVHMTADDYASTQSMVILK